MPAKIVFAKSNYNKPNIEIGDYIGTFAGNYPFDAGEMEAFNIVTIADKTPEQVRAAINSLYPAVDKATLHGLKGAYDFRLKVVPSGPTIAGIMECKFGAP